MARTVDRLASKPYPGGQGEIGFEFTSGSLRIRGSLLDKVPGLPPQRDVDFIIELHPGTSPISMTSHRMEPIELQEIKVHIHE